MLLVYKYSAEGTPIQNILFANGGPGPTLSSSPHVALIELFSQYFVLEMRFRA